jgi:hypothetical protein
MSSDEELTRLGWKRRFVACDPRLSEAVQLYEELGLEVHLEPLPGNPDSDGSMDECRICFTEDRQRYRIIYTRQR